MIGDQPRFPQCFPRGGRAAALLHRGGSDWTRSGAKDEAHPEQVSVSVCPDVSRFLYVSASSALFTDAAAAGVNNECMRLQCCAGEGAPWAGVCGIEPPALIACRCWGVWGSAWCVIASTLRPAPLGGRSMCRRRRQTENSSKSEPSVFWISLSEADLALGCASFRSHVVLVMPGRMYV